jgi:phage host-nuclease inhibitor protein Gam
VSETKAEQETLTLADVEMAVAELARLLARVKQAEGRCSELIAQAQANLQVETAKDREMEAIYLAALEDWAKQHRGEWGKAKSLKLAGGRIGFRDKPESLKAVGKGGWKAAVERVKRVLGAAFVRTEEEVDRDAIKAAKLGPEKLRTAGLKLEGGETFFVETPEVEL